MSDDLNIKDGSLAKHLGELKNPHTGMGWQWIFIHLANAGYSVVATEKLKELEDCIHCHGSGVIPDNDYVYGVKSCSNCDGTGKRNGDES